MNRFKLLCLLFISSLTVFHDVTFGQTNNFSPNQIFDTLRDNYGESHTLHELKIDTVTLDAHGEHTKQSPCISGYFKLYFEPGCGMDQNTTQHANRRAVMCNLFSHISSFINSPLTTTGQKVNIWIRNTTNMGLFNSNAGARTFYSGIGTGNIIDNEAWRTIQTGIDSYAGIVSPISTTGAFVNCQHKVYQT